MLIRNHSIYIITFITQNVPIRHDKKNSHVEYVIRYVYVTSQSIVYYNIAI